MTIQTFGTILGVLGFIISVYNLFSAIRNRTVNPQPQLLAELRGYLEVVYESCRQVRGRLNFDRHMIHTGHRPDIPPLPAEFNQAQARMLELGATLTSIGQKQIKTLHMLIGRAGYEWGTLKTCTDSDPVNERAPEFARNLTRYCKVIEKFFPDYIKAVTDINKGNIWKRYKYRDHRPFVYKLFRWTPLDRAVNEYDRQLRES